MSIHLEKQAKKARASAHGLRAQEYQTWAGFYRRAPSDEALATEILAQLDADPVMKRDYLGLYLSCKETLRRDKARQKRNRRIGEFVRLVCRGVFGVPARVRQALRRGGDIVVECLPEQLPAAPKKRSAPRPKLVEPDVEVIPGAIAQVSKPRPAKQSDGQPEKPLQ